MIVRTILLPFVATVLIAGCSSDQSTAGNTFPENERQNFLAGCEDSGGSVAACGCILEALEASWSYDEVDAMFRKAEADGRVPAEIARAAAGCARPA